MSTNDVGNAYAYVVGPLVQVRDGEYDGNVSVLRARFPRRYKNIYAYNIVAAFFQLWLNNQNRFIELRHLFLNAQRSADGNHSIDMNDALNATLRGINDDEPPPPPNIGFRRSAPREAGEDEPTTRRRLV